VAIAQPEAVSPEPPPAASGVKAPHRGNPVVGYLVLVCLLVLGAVVWGVAQKPTPPAAPTIAPTIVPAIAPERRPWVVVYYKLTGSAHRADLTYTNASGNIEQQSGVTVPLTNTSGGEGIGFTTQRGAFVSFTAQKQDKTGDLTCSIEADGVLLNTGHSSGGYTIVSCSATLP
jgi:hypothetical protein